MNSEKTKKYSINLLPLAIVFVVLKLTNTISWSWWWVLSPIWLPYAIILTIGLLGIIVIIFAHLFNK